MATEASVSRIKNKTNIMNPGTFLLFIEIKVSLKKHNIKISNMKFSNSLYQRIFVDIMFFCQ